MGIYILKRIVFVVSIGMIVLFVLSFFIPDYHYTHYHNVKILSEKKEIVHNHAYDNKDHDHYTINQIAVKWVGEDRTGKKYECTAKFKNKDDDYYGVSYHDLKNGIAKKHNRLRSIFTWIGFCCVFFYFLHIFSADSEDDYTYTLSDIKDIREWKLNKWRKCATFMGYDKKIIDIIYNRERSKNLITIPKYSELFSLYSSEQARLSQIEIKTNG